MRESGCIRGVRESERRIPILEGAVVKPLAAIRVCFERESGYEAPHTKRLNIEGALVRSLPRRNEGNHEAHVIRIGEINHGLS
ncbi:hypothetical protein TNCV_3265271 [Trichonephila clavipes]|nr:hypothetical protein TNCV_3265271 [Trichonephila clavipes]